jgi:uncharacterized protein
MLKKLSIYILFFLYSGLILAQESQMSVRLIARPLQDSILLRWAPTSFEVWQAANKSGYVIERFTLVRNGQLIRNSKGQVLTLKPLVPIPLSQWEPLADKDKYAGIAAQAIYGETFEVSAQKGSNVMDIVNKVSEQENRFGFALFAADQSSVTARASGLWYTDRNVIKGESYLYKVYLSAPMSFKVDTGYIFTGVDEYKPLPKPYRFHVEFGDNIAVLTWDKEATRGDYTGYIIEKSTENGNTFVPVNKEPLINPLPEGRTEYPFFYYIDSVRDNNKKYSYRVYGISPFGEKGPVSDTVSGKGVTQIKEVPHIIKKETIFDKQVKLEWDFPKDNEIEGFLVLRSRQDITGFKIISDTILSTSRTFIDNSPLPTNYYKVMAFNGKSIPAVSLPVLVQLEDSIPPAPPSGLKALADSTGKVVLRWKANREEDIYGYRVYRGNGKHEEFSQITVAPVTDTVFTDQITLKTLTKHVYYQILAVDQRQNYSAFSEILDVDRPDIMPPIAPVITNFTSGYKGNELTWVNSTSEDVAGNYLFRRLQDSEQWELIFTINNDSIISYLDSTAQSGFVYSYAMKAKDKSNLQSTFSKPVYCKTLNKNYQRLPALTGKPNRELNAIELSWTIDNKIKEYMIYKAEEGKPLTLYRNFDAKTHSFVDKLIIQNTSYTYCIKVKFDDETTSRLSSAIIVRF